jgi:hypothetical protein
MPVTIVPAQPGFNVVEPDWNEGATEVVGLSLTPVVAWAIEDYKVGSYNVALPITPEIFTDSDIACVRTPTGDFIFPGSVTLNNEVEVREYIQKRQKGRSAA